jgi:DTW domain-containing protein YfiP
MHETLCICALVPTIETRTRLQLVMHCREERKPTNTGALAARCLTRSSIAIVGDRDRPVTLAPILADEQPVVLGVAEDAVPLTELAASTRPIVLVVPDGSWRQANKMRKRVPGLSDMLAVTLPDLGPSNYRLRSEPNEQGLSTFEAIARALRILEGDRGEAIERAMIDLFQIMVDRSLWLRGSLATNDVTGGLPDAAIERNPRSTRATRG